MVTSLLLSALVSGTSPQSAVVSVDRAAVEPRVEQAADANTRAAGDVARAQALNDAAARAAGDCSSAAAQSAASQQALAGGDLFHARVVGTEEAAKASRTPTAPGPSAPPPAR